MQRSATADHLARRRCKYAVVTTMETIRCGMSIGKAVWRRKFKAIIVMAYLRRQVAPSLNQYEAKGQAKSSESKQSIELSISLQNAMVFWNYFWRSCLLSGKGRSKISFVAGRVFVPAPNFYGKATTKERERKSNERQAYSDIVSRRLCGCACRSNTIQCKRFYSRACGACSSAHNSAKGEEFPACSYSLQIWVC